MSMSTSFLYDDVVAGAVVANQAYAQRVKQAWAVKIANSSPKDLGHELLRLSRDHEIDRMLARTMRSGKLTESNNLGLSELERILKVKAQSLGGDDVLELLRITIMIAIVRQLQRQMMGLIG